MKRIERTVCMVLSATMLATMLTTMLVGCNKATKTHQEGPAVIEMNIDDAKVCTITKDQLIPLETTDSSLLYDINELISTDDKWIVRSRSYIRAFDKKSGKYLHNISRKGQGPEEYLDVNQLTNSGDTLHVLDTGSRCIKDFLSDGSFVGIRMDYSNIKADGYISAHYAVESSDGNNYFAINCYNGGYPAPPPQYMVISKDGEFVQHVPGRKLYDSSFTPDRMYTDFEHGRVLAWEQLRDTLFAVSEAGVEPIYVFDFGKNRFPLESQQKPEFYYRTKDYASPNGGAPYASFLKYYQVKGDNLYFSFIVNYGDDESGENKSDVYLAVVNEKTHEVKILNYESEDERYKQDSFFKVFDDKIAISVSDREDSEVNRYLLVLPLDSL